MEEFQYRNEVPESVLRDHFSHLNEDDSFDGFFQYRKHWYHLSDFMYVSKEMPFQGWNGYAPDSFFSGILIRSSNDGERYQVATYIS